MTPDTSTQEAIGQLAQGLAGLVDRMSTQQIPGGNDDGLAALLSAVAHAVATLDALTQNADPMTRLAVRKASVAVKTCELLARRR